MSPFSGLARLSNSSDSMSDSNTWALQLFPSDFSLSNYEILIDNIATLPSLSQKLRQVRAGQPLGWSRGSGGCGSQDFIHVTVKQRSGSGEKSLYVDPSVFLQPIRSPHVTSSLECNDYTIIYRGEVIKRGTLIPGSDLERKQSDLIRSGGQQSLPNIKSSFSNTDQPVAGSPEQISISEQLDKYEWSTASSGVRPLHPKSWEDPVSVIAPTAVSMIDSLTVGEVKAILGKAGATDLRDNVAVILDKLAAAEAMKTCSSVNYLTTSELQDWLLEMGKSVVGSRHELVERLLIHPSQGKVTTAYV